MRTDDIVMTSMRVEETKRYDEETKIYLEGI